MKETDYDELSFKQLLKYAEKGDEWAQYLVGLEYAFPENDEEADEEEAVRWFSKAAEAGVPEACFRMAERMFTGSGIEQDTEAAYDFMYGAGVPVEEDMDKCRELLEKGASMGSEYAQSLLDELDNGTLFEDGEDEDDYDDDYEDDDDEDEDDEDDDDEDDDEKESTACLKTGKKAGNGTNAGQIRMTSGASASWASSIPWKTMAAKPSRYSKRA